MIERVPKLFLQILQNRFELLSLEMKEEKVRVKKQIMLAAVGAVLGVIGLIGFGILTAYFIPTTDRFLVVTIIVAVFIVAAIVLLLTARRLSSKHTPLEATLAALNKDIYTS